MSAVTLTGRVVWTPRLSALTPSRPGVRTSFVLEGRHSGSRVELHATAGVAERITASVSAGDLITVSCWSEERTNRSGDRARHVLFVDSFTVHPPKDAA